MDHYFLYGHKVLKRELIVGERLTMPSLKWGCENLRMIWDCIWMWSASLVPFLEISRMMSFMS